MLRGVGSSAILLLVRVRAAECRRSNWMGSPALAKFSLPSLKKSFILSPCPTPIRSPFKCPSLAASSLWITKHQTFLGLWRKPPLK